LLAMRIYSKGSQRFQACGPINKQTEGSWPTHCITSPMSRNENMKDNF